MATEKTVRDKEHPDFGQFYEKAVLAASDLRNFVQSSLLASENQGLIDRSYYDPDGVVDEIYLAVFNEYEGQFSQEELKIALFRHALQKLDQLIRDEEYTPNEPSTGGLLKDELDALDDQFTAEFDGDLILREDLDDISYKQEKRRNEPIYLDEKLVTQIVDRFELDDKFTLAKNKKIHLGILYSSIPAISRSIVELYVYGHQEQGDIVKILDVEEASVTRVLKIVREKFRLI